MSNSKVLDSNYTTETRKLVKELTKDSISIILKDYKAAIHFITDAFNDKLVKYDKQIELDIKIQLKPLIKIQELPDYGEDYRTDK